MSEEIMTRIAVTPPYFALDELTIPTADRVTARFCAQHPMKNEAGPIAAAEVGRHLAILGSCALANANPVTGKHYYVACQAELRQVGNAETVDTDHFLAQSDVVQISKTAGTTEATVQAACGARLYALTTHYRIVKARIFERIYQTEKLEFEPQAGFNPYASTFDYDTVHVDGGHLSACFGPLPPEQCDGHFAAFPFIPVAVLMQILSHAAGELLGHRLNDHNARYEVVSADIEADSFAYTHERLSLNIDEVHTDETDYIFNCRAEASDRQIGAMTLILRPAATSRADPMH